MAKSSNKYFLFIWLILIAILLIYFTNALISGDDKTLFMPGALTDGHHQIGMACEACHQNSFDNREQIVNSCIKCHGDERKKPFDSHPKQKFTDPRNADRLQKIDALNCITCHVEHQPDITKKTGLTQPVDFCVHCHDDIADKRPSHKNMAFDSCASAGCHNYHNNRSLYTDFLIKHLDEPSNLEKAILPKREFSALLDEIVTYPHSQYPVKPLTLDDIDKPENIASTDNINNDWLQSGHSKKGGNCSSCHQQKSNDKNPSLWITKPDHNACASCHEMEVKHFKRGKHGMRLEQGLSAMMPEMARLPMTANSLNEELTCNSCHRAHKYDLVSAAVDACLGCHNDRHSLAYKKSKHFDLWQLEQADASKQGTGVSCASCHMPRISYDVSEWLSRIMVQHNQNANLVPNEKMIRSVCIECHGLEFSIDSLADKNLIEHNFNGKPSIHIQSMDLARKDHQRHLEKTKSDE
ncbi:MAG: cytochrome c3 family protein [Gammaproteobacteria bacterium]|nr:cytochrome c3 family protein [Gammaproteobacteria bacterium]